MLLILNASDGMSFLIAPEDHSAKIVPLSESAKSLLTGETKHQTFHLRQQRKLHSGIIHTLDQIIIPRGRPLSAS